MDISHLAEVQTSLSLFSFLIQHHTPTLWHHSGLTMIYVHQEKCPMKYTISVQDICHQ